MGACPSPLLPDQHATGSSGKSSGVFPALKADPYAFYRLFRDQWPEFLRFNFRNSVDVAAFFSVNDRTARGWLEGVTAPRGQVVAYAVARMPKETAKLLRVA